MRLFMTARVWLRSSLLILLCCTLPPILNSCCEDCDPCVTCPPRDGWWIQETPTEADLYQIQAFDENHLIAVGSGGVIIRSEDGGWQWDLVPNGTGETLRGLSFGNADTCYAVGNYNTVLKSIDGGLSWEPLALPVETHPRDVFFVDANTGWICGGPLGDQTGENVVLKTVDGGLNWSVQLLEFTPRNLEFVDALHGFTVGGSDFRRTLDGGETWEIYDPEPPSWFGSICFIDEMTGWVGGALGFLSTSSDGGVNWDELDSGTERNIVELYFVDELTGWYIARNPSILGATVNGGQTWSFQTYPAEQDPTELIFIDDETGWICGNGGLVLKTETGGW